MARQDFLAVPVRAFDLLWTGRTYKPDQPMEIELRGQTGWKIAMIFYPNSREQIYVRPSASSDVEALKAPPISTVFVPPMTGLGIEEPVFQRPYVDGRLGMARPGEVLRNLLVEASRKGEAWAALSESIRHLFGYELTPPNADGQYIRAEYRESAGGSAYDIASSGSGFQQVLMLLSFLNTRPASVLLLDEPDAHLHVVLQDAVYDELRTVAMQKGSQLIVATHSEVIINGVEPRELFAVMHGIRKIETVAERSVLIRALRVLDNMDIMLAMEARGVLYTEGKTDLDILREWAKVLQHPAYNFLTSEVFWKPAIVQPREGVSGTRAVDHYEALKLVRHDIPGLILVDGDARPEIEDTPLSGQGLQRLRWKRYEIENYLLHPAAIRRYVQKITGAETSDLHIRDLDGYFHQKYPPDFLVNPLEDLPFLVAIKGRVGLIPPALEAAGLHGIPYTRFHEIAALMKPEEIHPEVKEKLDGILKAFNIA
jgi:hypothetical protein